jgi:hypothetical protein
MELSKWQFFRRYRSPQRRELWRWAPSRSRPSFSCGLSATPLPPSPASFPLPFSPSLPPSLSIPAFQHPASSIQHPASLRYPLSWLYYRHDDVVASSGEGFQGTDHASTPIPSLAHAGHEPREGGDQPRRVESTWPSHLA